MICVVKFYIITTCILIFKNKYAHLIEKFYSILKVPYHRLTLESLTNNIQTCLKKIKNKNYIFLSSHYPFKIFIFQKAIEKILNFSLSHISNSILIFFTLSLKFSAFIFAVMLPFLKHDEEKEDFFMIKMILVYFCHYQ